MAHQYTTEVVWNRGDQIFSDNKYSRAHLLKFDGGIEVQGSSSPLVVPLPYSVENAIDPEEAFISSLSSCHMLWFLSIAVKHGFVVDSYHDNAVGVMTMNERKKLWVSEVTLNPFVVFSGAKIPAQEDILRMHDEAHEECFIANSVKSAVRIVSQ